MVHQAAVASALLHLPSLSSSVVLLGQSFGIPIASKSDGFGSRKHFQELSLAQGWILDSTLELSNQIWLNSEVSSQSSHRSSSDRTIWSEHHVTIAFVESPNPNSFHPLHIQLPPQTRRINRHANHARCHERKQRTLATLACPDFPWVSTPIALRLETIVCPCSMSQHPRKGCVSMYNVLTSPCADSPSSVRVQQLVYSDVLSHSTDSLIFCD